MRRPARLERAGALTPRDRVWAAIRDFGPGNTFSVAEIMLLSEQRPDTVLSYAGGLVKAGYLLKGAPRPGRRPRREFQWFSLVRDVGIEAPRVDANGKPVTQSQGALQMWRAMRAHKGSFTAKELCLTASTEDCVIAEATAIRYCRFLGLAGYLAVNQTAGGGTKRNYRFIKSRDTGPRPPMITARDEVQDANTGAIVYAKAAQ